jgi:hypothetical protein
MGEGKDYLWARAALCPSAYSLVHRGTRRNCNGRLLLGAATYMLKKETSFIA